MEIKLSTETKEAYLSFKNLAKELINSKKYDELSELAKTLVKELSIILDNTENVFEKNLVAFLSASLLEFDIKISRKRYKDLHLFLNNMTEIYLAEVTC